MGYDIFAVGVIKQPNGSPYRYKNYKKSDRMWGDEWEMNKMLDLGLSMKGVNTGGSISGEQTINLMKGLAMMTFKRLMGDAIQILAMEAEGTLSIYTRDKNLIMPDETGFKTFTFTSSTFSSEYKRMLKHMEKVGLNKMGPMMDMCYALSDWSSKGKRGKYIFRFEFEWS